MFQLHAFVIFCCEPVYVQKLPWCKNTATKRTDLEYPSMSKVKLICRDDKLTAAAQHFACLMHLYRTAP